MSDERHMGLCIQELEAPVLAFAQSGIQCFWARTLVALNTAGTLSKIWQPARLLSCSKCLSPEGAAVIHGTSAQDINYTKTGLLSLYGVI